MMMVGIRVVETADGSTGKKSAAGVVEEDELSHEEALVQHHFILLL